MCARAYCTAHIKYHPSDVRQTRRHADRQPHAYTHTPAHTFTFSDTSAGVRWLLMARTVNCYRHHHRRESDSVAPSHRCAASRRRLRAHAGRLIEPRFFLYAINCENFQSVVIAIVCAPNSGKLVNGGALRTSDVGSVLAMLKSPFDGVRLRMCVSLFPQTTCLSRHRMPFGRVHL